MVSFKEISDFTGIATSTLSTWSKDGVFDKSSDLRTVVKAIVRYLRERNLEGLDYTQEKTRLAKAQADKIELELDLKNRVLMRGDLVLGLWDRYITGCKARLLAIPSRLAYELAGIGDPSLVEETLRECVYEALEELSSERFVEGIESAVEGE